MQLDGDSDKSDDEEMDVSDDEPPAKKMKKSSASSDSLKEENDSLRCQLEAYKNEVDMIKSDAKSEAQAKDETIATYKNTLQGMQETLQDNVSRKLKMEAKIADLTDKFKKLQDKYKKNASTDKTEDKEDMKELLYEEVVDVKDDDISLDCKVAPDDKTARMIGLVSTFLHIHPKGASVDYIWSYIQQFDKEIRPEHVESILKKYPSVYRQISTGVGACLERKWIFTGLSSE